MTKLSALLLAASLATAASPALAQTDQHMMGDHGQGMMGGDDHGQGMMGNDDHGQGMMDDGDHGNGTMGDHGQGMMGNDHGMSGQDGQ